jgi:phosphoesterase RecJ-like protein
MTRNKADIDLLIRLIEENDDFLLTSHQDPDGDSIGSLVGLYNYLQSLGKRAVIYNQGNIPDKYRFLNPGGVIKNEPPSGLISAGVAIILECPRYERIGFVQTMITPEMTIVNIDHHEDNQLFGKINIVDTGACAVGEILYEIFASSGNPITADIANPLYAALISDTGCFRFANTNSRCLNVAAALVEKGAQPKLIAEKIFFATTPETLKLIGHVLGNMQFFANGKICVFKLSRDDPQKYGASMENSEGVIDYTMMMNQVNVGVFFKEFDSETIKVSLRSQNSIDIGLYAKSKGGGGHPNAAGFTLNTRLEAAIQTVVKELTEHINV